MALQAWAWRGPGPACSGWTPCGPKRRVGPQRLPRPPCAADGKAAPAGAGTAPPGLDVLSPGFARSLQLDQGTLDALMALPGTSGPAALGQRARALSAWKSRLRAGALPAVAGPWPDGPLADALVASLRSLEMPRFCRRHPALLDALLKQLLEVVHEYEARLEEAEAEGDGPAAATPPDASSAGEPPPDADAGDPGSAGQAGETGPEGQEAGGDAAAPADAEVQGVEGGTAGSLPRTPGDGGELTLSLDAGAAPGPPSPERPLETAEALAARMADELAAAFEAEWKPVAESLAAAEGAFDDLSGLADGPLGFDRSHAVWRDAGWREVADLSRRLEKLRELRDLVRSLGRASGRGPLRRAPEQVASARAPPGVLRSPLQPEETRGLARSGDLSRMLPFEAHLVAAGWPRGRGTMSDDGDLIEGSRPARLLHMARRAERTLLSYERAGWMDGEPARVTGRSELRPAAELGPIIVCLDTSGSMAGARETVAKAVALECMRGAHRARRRCLLFAFSGPGDVRALDLRVDADALAGLLDFLRGSFGGGTDADAPLELSLERLEQAEWCQADILVVTDGEIAPPSPGVLARLDAAKANMGLEVHGLLVGRGDEPSEAVRAICSHVHVFKSWSAVGGR